MYDRERMIATIIKAYGINRAIINDIGFKLAEPIVMVTGEMNFNWIAKSMTNFETVTLNEFMKKRDVEKILNETYSEFVLAEYPTTKEGHKLIDHTIASAKSAMGYGHKNCAPVLFLAKGGLRRKDMENCFNIYLEGELFRNPSISLEEVVPQDRQVEVVLDKIKEIDMVGRTRTEQALLAASCFRYPYLKEHNQLNEYEELFRCVEYLVMQNEDVNFIADVGKSFIDIIYKWQERTRFHNAYELPNIERNVIEHIDEVFLFDDEHFYMREPLFATIALPLLNVFPLEVLKSALSDEGILCRGNEKTYTIKVGYYNISGVHERKRMLRFKRSVFSQLGEPDLIDMCLGCKEESEYED